MENEVQGLIMMRKRGAGGQRERDCSYSSDEEPRKILGASEKVTMIENKNIRSCGLCMCVCVSFFLSSSFGDFFKCI